MSRVSYVEDNELVTYERPHPMGNILSRICRYYSSFAPVHGSRYEGNQKARRSFNIESSIENKQAAKVRETFSSLVDLKHTTSATTGSNRLGSLITRRRSFHISACKTRAKGNSIGAPSIEIIDNDNLNLTREVKPKKVAKQVRVTTIMKEYLELRSGKDQKHYQILNKISSPEFLVACYEEIKSKPGNMTRGSDKETLDGLT